MEGSGVLKQETASPDDQIDVARGLDDVGCLFAIIFWGLWTIAGAGFIIKLLS